MSDAIQMLEVMVGAQLAREELPSRERIRDLIAALRKSPICADVTDEQAENLALFFEATHGVTMTVGSVLTEESYQPWLADAKAEITPYYWDRYRKLLAEKGFSGQVLATLDKVTDTILNALENPQKPGPWDRRGMVVGHVQSGKTANYTGLICKAADAGYRLVVVIAGIHNNLRNQTQRRIDEGFVGRDSANIASNRVDKFIGVGKFDKTRRPVTFTSSIKDFNSTLANGVGVPLKNLTEPAVFVIKKNSKTLENLINWLQQHNARIGTSKIDAPMLLVDDEADNASINTKSREEASRINGQIRTLLKIFDRSCYVGYTATPFANIFIDPSSSTEMLGQDLFPRHFIVSLDPPTNYFGARKVFIDSPSQVLRPISDNEDVFPLVHKKDFKVTTTPGSLKTAIRTFVLGRAIRLARGEESFHCSMLVNVSRFTDVQRQLRNEIHEFIEFLKSSIRVNGSLKEEKALLDPEIAALHNVWLDEFASTTEFDWKRIQGLLNEAIQPISVVEVNSRSAGSLNYNDHAKTGLNVIAVGGYALSRGLTLEGLMVSYFLRNSVMYDTLMQMGRWFGYRTGYEDLCRVWMPEAAEGWYAHITESIDELREELRQMEQANATPEQFGLKVRSHPDTLIVTAYNKMGSGEQIRVSVGLANQFVETAILRRDKGSLASNRESVIDMVKSLRAIGKPLSEANRLGEGFLICDVPVEIVRQFLGAFRNHPVSMLTDPAPILRYISDRQNTELAKWDILFPSLGGKDQKTLADSSLGVEIRCQRRSSGKKSTESILYVTEKQRVASRGIEKTGLSRDEIEDAESEYRKTYEPKTDKSNLNYPDRIYRAVRKRPLLIVHLLAIGDKDADLSHTVPVVAWGISFPSTKMKEKLVEYVVNDTWKKENFRDELDEEEEDGDQD